MKKNTPSNVSSNEIAKKIRNREIVVRVATLVVVSFLLAIMVRASSINEFNTIKDFFTGKVWLQILIISVILAAMLSTIYFYSIYIRRDLRKDKKLVQVLTSSIVLTFVLALVFGSLINLYVAPLVLSSLLVGALLDKRIGIVTNILISQAFFLTAMIVFGADRIIESSAALITSMITSIFLISNLDKMRTRFRFTVLGLLVGLCTAVIPMLINLLVNPDDILTVLMSGVWSFLSVVLSIALQMIFLPIMEYIFRINTVFRLGELCSLENPLLKKLAVNAPGTFNHSVAVGNLAEICADAIGENPQLAKVCAYYHDVGKMKNSEYFIENQSGLPEDNPHNDLIPEVSVSMIVSHVQASYDMIKAERLPDIIADVAREHHGTTPVNYFLYKAQSYTEDDLNKLEFSYPGPKPQTKIAAIIMIVDTVEAASRAIANLSSHDQFRKFIHNLIKSKSDVGQFEECGITFKDLKTIEDTLVETLPSMYHSRIQYTKPSEK